MCIFQSQTPGSKLLYGYSLFYLISCFVDCYLNSGDCVTSRLFNFTLSEVFVSFYTVDFIIIRPFGTKVYFYLSVTHTHGNNLEYLIQQ